MNWKEMLNYLIKDNSTVTSKVEKDTFYSHSNMMDAITFHNSSETYEESCSEDCQECLSFLKVNPVYKCTIEHKEEK